MIDVGAAADVRHLAFIGLVVAVAAVQSALAQVAHLDVARPILAVPLVLYFALHLNTIEGALLSAGAGFASDAASGYPSGLATFALVLIFVATRLILAGLRGEGLVFDMLFAGGLATAYHLVTLGVSRVFGPAGTPIGETPWFTVMMWGSLATALATPFVVALARRVDRIGARPNEMLSQAR